MRTARPLTAWMRAASLHWLIRRRRVSPEAAALRRAALEGHPDGNHRIARAATTSGRLPAVGTRHSARLSKPAGARAALAADHAGHDFWRGRGGGHAFDRRRRAPEGHG